MINEEFFFLIRGIGYIDNKHINGWFLLWVNGFNMGLGFGNVVEIIMQGFRWSLHGFDFSF